MTSAKSDIGLQLNSHKKKWMGVGASEDIFVRNRLIEKLEDYVYIRYKTKLGRESLDGETDRPYRARLGSLRRIKVCVPGENPTMSQNQSTQLVRLTDNA